MDQRLIIRADKVYHGRTKDLSEGGLGATIAGELPSDGPFELEFYLPGKLSPIQVRAEVRHHQGFYYGFRFTEVTTQQRDEIRSSLLTLAVSMGTA